MLLKYDKNNRLLKSGTMYIRDFIYIFIYIYLYILFIYIYIYIYIWLNSS